MSPKRGDRAAPPPLADEWDIRFATNDAAKGWDELCRQAPGNTHAAWHEMRTTSVADPHRPRHHPLRGSLAHVPFGGRKLPQRQIEVTGSGRVWYVVDEERRTLWITHAGTGHPKATE